MQEALRRQIHHLKTSSSKLCYNESLLDDTNHHRILSSFHALHKNPPPSSCIELQQDRPLSIFFCPLHIFPSASTGGRILGSLAHSHILHPSTSKLQSETGFELHLQTI